MSLHIASLNSGSNGNCYYIGNEHEAVLIDAGISCRETERRMRRLNLSMDRVKAIFISHEHIDHIRGMQVLQSKHRLPVYITAATLANSRMQLEQSLVHSILPYTPFVIGNITVTAFPKVHDAAEPHSFMVSDHEVNVGVITDIGLACEHVITNFKKCHAAFLEANYDEVMLETGNYPFHLKRRIRGGKGHLSNSQALELVTVHRPEFMGHLLLAHLSKNNNTPEIVDALFAPFRNEMNVVVASRYVETNVYHVLPQPAAMTEKTTVPRPVQATLF